MTNDNFMLFSGTSHPKFSEELAQKLGVSLGKAQIELFPDGEIGAQILENVRGRDVFVVQSIAKKPNFYLMELLILIDALKRASARSIVAVIPYFGYARQDRKDKGRVPITAKLVANLLETAGVTRVVTMDLHSEQIQGFFDIPVDNLYGQSLFAKAIQKTGLKDLVVCAPDVGSAKLARLMASELGASFAIVDKQRTSAKDVETHALVGDVQGKDVVLVDDICSTGSTLEKASEAVRKAGAGRVVAAVTHPLFSREWVERSKIDHFFVANTIPLPHEIPPSLVETLSVAGLFGKAIECIVHNESISSLFRPRS
ncbi:MAG: ribose-phosphate pyrophosphokinase [Chlamydiales bacterium]|nr:ribose-phosphate pyrophosphokinase [Chlamydiales bacterium]